MMSERTLLKEREKFHFTDDPTTTTKPPLLLLLPTQITLIAEFLHIHQFLYSALAEFF